MKKCTKCGIEKSLSEFYKDSSVLDGYKNSCKACLSEQSKIRYKEKTKDKKRKKRKDAIKIFEIAGVQHKQCTKCLASKPLSNFYALNHTTGRLSSRCKGCTRKDASERYSKNREEILKRNREKYSYKPIIGPKKSKTLLDVGGELWKKCSKCKTAKPLSDFGKCSKNLDGLKYQCRECISNYRKLPEVKKRRQDWWKNYDYEGPENLEELIEEVLKDRPHLPRDKGYNFYRLRQGKDACPCIYKITNKETGKVYVGQTSMGVNRWKRHLVYLRGKYHKNHLLQKDFDEFGEETFEWEMIKELPEDKEVLLLEEVRTISRFLKEDKDLYNLALTIEQLKLLQENGE